MGCDRYLLLRRLPRLEAVNPLLRPARGTTDGKAMHQDGRSTPRGGHLQWRCCPSTEDRRTKARLRACLDMVKEVIRHKLSDRTTRPPRRCPTRVFSCRPLRPLRPESTVRTPSSRRTFRTQEHLGRDRYRQTDTKTSRHYLLLAKTAVPCPIRRTRFMPYFRMNGTSPRSLEVLCLHLDNKDPPGRQEVRTPHKGMVDREHPSSR